MATKKAKTASSAKTGKNPMRVVHFEIDAKDPDVLAKFYRDLFHWEIKKWEDGMMDYWMIDTGKSETGIGGGMTKSSDSEPWPRVVNTINVPSVSDFEKRVVDAGGKVLKPKTAIPEMGYIAYCSDPEGIVFGIFEMDMKAK